MIVIIQVLLHKVTLFAPNNLILNVNRGITSEHHFERSSSTSRTQFFSRLTTQISSLIGLKDGQWGVWISRCNLVKS